MDNLSDNDPDDDEEYQTEVVGSSTSEATEASIITSTGNISNEEVSAAFLVISTRFYSSWFQLADVLTSKMVPARMRRAHAAKRKRSEKSAGKDPQRSEATTPGITPSSSFVVEGSSKETKQVSLLLKCIFTTE